MIIDFISGILGMIMVLCAFDAIYKSQLLRLEASHLAKEEIKKSGQSSSQIQKQTETMDMGMAMLKKQKESFMVSAIVGFMGGFICLQTLVNYYFWSVTQRFAALKNEELIIDTDLNGEENQQLIQ